MTPTLGNETLTVQNPLIRYAMEIGWQYLPQGQALGYRRGETGWLLYPVLERKLLELNPGIVSPDTVGGIIERIEAVRISIEGNAEILAWLRGQRGVAVAGESRQRNVTLVDYENPQNNVFQVTDEWQFTNGQFTNRADVLFLINGVPVALVETKSAARKDGMDNALTQVQRYHRETPEMLVAPQVFDITHIIDFYYGATWSTERKNLFNWKDEEPGNFEKKVKRFFARERFLKMLGEWIVFYMRDDELRKIILRQHQTRAVEKVVERALDPAKKRGLIWHTQGAGKTFTMISAAEHLLKHPAFAKPTVIMLVDRNELEGQLFTNLTAYGITPEVATSKWRLRELLRDDYRGLIVSMIHKFDKADADLCARDNVFILVDEAHRTTGGDLGNYLLAALPHATLLGFTGTPIDKTQYGKGTFKTFGVDDAPQGYTDKYSISESIADGTTLKLTYTLAPSEIRVPRELLEKEFLALAAAEGVADIEELNRILDEAVNLKAFLKAGDRIGQVAKFVADHYRSSVEPLGYKAFLVGVDREACALYKKALDKHLPADYSTVVYTAAHNDNELLAEFHLEETQEKQVRKAFIKRDQQPKILIVTEKLLTGFDAPILYCMYLDKPMRDHTLLQAIARVNRPYEDDSGIAKPEGLVVDFVGIFERLETALAFDSDEVASVIRNISVLKDRFAALMGAEAQAYLALCRGPLDDKAVERVIETFADKSARDTFIRCYRELETLYEIISPDAFLRDYIADYTNLAMLYRIVLNAFGQRTPLLKELMRKTEALVRQHTTMTGLVATLPAVTIDDKMLQALKDGKGKVADVINLGRALMGKIGEQGEQEPYLIPIGERAGAVLEMYDDRQLTTQEALQRLQELMNEYLAARAEREQAGFNTQTFTIYWLLKQEQLPEPGQLAEQLGAEFACFPHFRDNVAEFRQLKAALYKQLLPAAGKDRMLGIAERLLKLYRN